MLDKLYRSPLYPLNLFTCGYTSFRLVTGDASFRDFYGITLPIILASVSLAGNVFYNRLFNTQNLQDENALKRGISWETIEPYKF